MPQTAISGPLFVDGQADGTCVTAAWVFVAFRALHGAIHCTVDVVLPRFALYPVSTLAVWFVFVRAALGHPGA